MDKVYEAYMGAGSSEFTQKTRERIHWICEQVTGEDILDIGCSQGIVPLLLAKSGKKVLGVDVLPESIDYANELLCKEDTMVQSKVSFICADFLNYDFNQQYDTIILTEVLEHILYVDQFMEKAVSMLKKSGKIVITVPFGINDFWDHKRTYYFYDLFEEISPFVQINDTNFFSQWIGVVCEVKDRFKFKRQEFDLNILKMEEAVFYERERQLLNDKNRLKEKNQEQAEKIELLYEQIGKYKEKLERSLREIDRLKELNQELKNKRNG